LDSGRSILAGCSYDLVKKENNCSDSHNPTWVPKITYEDEAV